MPIYEYRCTSCEQLTEIYHGFDEKHTGVCPICGDALTRHFSANSILFKGSGFYVNDSRSSGERSGEGASAAETSPAASAPPAAGTPPASGSPPAAAAPAPVAPPPSAAPAPRAADGA